ncbi:phosphotransferase enzyme family protein [Dubosiella newyorkensis]|uniref:Aminoglycoside phosphotransferase domain-containing protein n=1 Tax=Dubosiella newyorkensis TaxID=1862672 RepID=A0A1U7NMK5_9FIRM|nr:phosphotransferase [Dubosiella newyorkensis]OLU46460.1 hypothetical protein BO225_06000 [Dubosiella newyorkensis]
MSVIETIPVAKIFSEYFDIKIITRISVIDDFWEPPKFSFVYFIETIDNEHFVMKLISDHTFSRQQNEDQIEFSEYLRSKGVPTARFFPLINSDGKYCYETDLHHLYENARAFVSLQEYVGRDIKSINLINITAIGRLIGLSHSFGKSFHRKLPLNFALRALYNGKTEFDQIWSGINTSNEVWQPLRKVHKKSIKTIIEVIHKLPCSAVHGDLGLTSNVLMDSMGTFRIIDFNLSGRCPCLLDFLITWYSSRYQQDFIGEVRSVEMAEQYRNAYISSYSKYYRLNTLEKENINILSKCLNGIYLSRFIAGLIREGLHISDKSLMIDFLAKGYTQVDSFFAWRD